MTTLDYVEIPPFATLLRSTGPVEAARPAPKIITSLPRPEHSPVRLSSPTATQAIMSPAKSVLDMPQLLLSSTLRLPASSTMHPNANGHGRLLSIRDPLSLPIMTANFRRFVAKVGPVFWLQDRFEEILLWKKGWKHTMVWMTVYAFLCYFPRMILLVPHVILLSILLATHPAILHASDDGDHEESSNIPTPPPAQTAEGSVDYFANVQAIQNLMGAYSDFHDAVLPVVPHLTHGSQYTALILTLTSASLLLFLPLVLILPLRFTLLTLGLAPFLLTHPFTRFTLIPSLQTSLVPLAKRLYASLLRTVDNDRLEDKHWNAPLREVELWENERWKAPPTGEDASAADAGWAKVNLRPGERRAWTRGRDGWSGISDDGSGDVSNLTFSLAPGWYFVETEDWRTDLEGMWNETGADETGWVYTNDAWLDPQPTPPEEWKVQGMTRRRRWTRRIYNNLYQ